MRALLSTITLALVLSARPTVALADDGEDQDVTKPGDDPGITALHQAIDDMRDARTALRTECPNMGDAKCRAEFKKVREAFKDAHDKAIAAHHAFRQKAKDAHKDNTPLPTPRG